MDEEELEFSEEVGLTPVEGEEQKALLVGVFQGNVERSACDEHLAELAALSDTFGIDVAQKFPCPLRKIDSATFLGKGKVEELSELVKKLRATVLIFDEDISPAQQRNLEKIIQVPVMDRTELILEIFAQRAQTKEARLQVELARVKYQFPRLKRLWSHFSRQRASGGYLKGEGEKQIELDRRLLDQKIEKLTKELNEVKKYRQTQKAARVKSGVPTFAIIGYTNAGKSTLLNALTEAGVFVEDKLFATLDPTTRKFTLPNNQEILLTDTVGFIRKLPHSLIAAFKSTLEAALQDDVLLHIIDASSPIAEEHAKTSHAILNELAVEKRPIITVLNKIDACQDPDLIERLRVSYPKTVLISAITKEGFPELMQMMIEEIAARRQTIKLKIPQKEYALVTILRREGHIHYEEYEENDIILLVDIPLPLLHRIEPYRIKEL